MKPAVNIFWFRRDLRLHDNTGLYHALRSNRPVLPLFIFDRNILDELDDPADRRVEFIHQQVSNLQDKLIGIGSTLYTRYGKPAEIFGQLMNEYEIETVFTNHDYEPYAKQRDENIGLLLINAGINFKTFKDQLIFERSEIVKDDGKPYTVFTPYSRKWKSVLSDFYLSSYPTEKYFSNFHQQKPLRIPALEELGFKAVGEGFPAMSWNEDLIRHYKEQRDFPAICGTSRLSVHLRFGTISIRELARQAGAISETFLNELIWREFYQMILWHFPQVVDQSFKPEYDRIKWRNNEKEFDAWCKGQTGYPIVDAGMRELNEAGFMHNRVRMIVASFLTKHLLIDWRWGEAYFVKNYWITNSLLITGDGNGQQDRVVMRRLISGYSILICRRRSLTRN